MAPQEHRPIPDRNPPYMLAGLVVGVVVGLVGAHEHKRIEAWRRSMSEVAVVVPVAPLPPLTTTTTTTNGPPTNATAPAKKAVEQPTMPPFPGRGGTGSSMGPDGWSTMQYGAITATRDDAIALYAKAFGACGRTVHVGRTHVVWCAGDDFYDSFVVVDAQDGGVPHALATATTYRAPPPAPRDDGRHGPCGAQARFVETPPGAYGVTTSGGRTDHDEDGTCSFYVPEPANDALDDVTARIFGPSDHPLPRETIGFENNVRFVVAGVRDGVYWRITATASDATHAHVEIRRFNGGTVPALPIVVGDPARIARLQRCNDGCAPLTMASLPASSAVEAHMAWDATFERCLYACDGEPAPPNRVAPFDAFVSDRAR